jgi:hypothetical protein
LVGPSDLPVPAYHRNPERALIENHFQNFICPEQILFGLPVQFDGFFLAIILDVYGVPPLDSGYLKDLSFGKKYYSRRYFSNKKANWAKLSLGFLVL